MEGELQVTVGENLKQVREGWSLTQEKMAEHLGHHRTYVGSLERGERNLSLRTIERLALMLGLDPLALLTPGPLTVPAAPTDEAWSASRPS